MVVLTLRLTGRIDTAVMATEDIMIVVLPAPGLITGLPDLTMIGTVGTNHEDRQLKRIK